MLERKEPRSGDDTAVLARLIQMFEFPFEGSTCIHRKTKLEGTRTREYQSHTCPFPQSNLHCRFSENVRDKGHISETIAFGAKFLLFEDENFFLILTPV